MLEFLKEPKKDRLWLALFTYFVVRGTLFSWIPENETPKDVSIENEADFYFDLQVYLLTLKNHHLL